ICSRQLGAVVDVVHPAVIVSGTSGGNGFESVAFYNDTTAVVNTATNDGATPNDSVTINSLDGTAATGATIQNFTVQTGTTGTDSVAVDGAVKLPGELYLNTGTITETSPGLITAADLALSAGSRLGRRWGGCGFQQRGSK